MISVHKYILRPLGLALTQNFDEKDADEIQ